MRVSFRIITVVVLCFISWTRLASCGGLEYTAFDSASWAITSTNVSDMLHPTKQSMYEDHIRQCNIVFASGDAIKASKSKYCEENDALRIEMNARQPQSVRNYTENGYKKIRTPPELFSLIKDFWDANRNKSETEWNSVTVYQNSWNAPSEMVHLAREEFGGSNNLQKKIFDNAKPILEEWTHHYLEPVSLWGIRIYRNSSVLVPHVDRMPLIISAIIQVDQDVEEPWPLEVYGHDGKAANITMEPGDMVLYESHSVIHGRPFPLQGNFFANAFIHFEINSPINGESTYDPELDIPPYVIPGSFWHGEWKTLNPQGWKAKAIQQEDVLILVAKGDIAGIQKLAHETPQRLSVGDKNGWTALHESIRSGKLGVLKALIGFGLDKNLLTAAGLSPLHYARYYFGKNHEITKYLESIGASDIKLPENQQEREYKNEEL